MRKKTYGALAVSLLISLGVGGLSAFLTRNSMDLYETIRQPPLAPPSVVFPIVWTILFALMGVSAWRVWRTNAPGRKAALRLYGLQLLMNGLWSILFFNGRLFWAAFVWLLALAGAIFVMILRFSAIDKLAGRLQIPYFLWVCFAGYLNLAIAILNP